MSDTSRTTETEISQTTAADDAVTNVSASQDGAPSGEAAANGGERRRILIGSQRDAAQDSAAPVRPTSLRPTVPTPLRPVATPAAAPSVAATTVAPVTEISAAEPTPAAPAPGAAEPADAGGREERGERRERGPRRRDAKEPLRAPPTTRRVAVPSLRDALDDELEAEFAAMMGGADGAGGASPVETLLAADEKRSRESTVEVGEKCQGRVVSLRKDCLFVDLGGSEQGVMMYRSMPGVESGELPLPEEGQTIEVYVSRLNVEDGLYELTLPGAAMRVEDWSDLSEGLVVEAKVTGHNKGGLECEVNHIRGFIPMGQMAIYRIEDPSECVGSKWNCLIMECDPMRRKLVLSRKSILLREQEAAKQEFRATLAIGQVRDGVVRRLMNFGAFVELGPGVDALLPISQLSWARVGHPSEVLSAGQTVRVRIERIDEETGKISLSYKDLLENPWKKAPDLYLVGSVYTGRVTRLADFGAFVQLEPGVEGLVHISEIAHARVSRVADVLKEGEAVQVQVVTFDEENRRIGLSIKACLAAPVSATPVSAEGATDPAAAGEGGAADGSAAPAEAAVPAKKSGPQWRGELRGGTGRPGSDGGQFGLRW